MFTIKEYDTLLRRVNKLENIVSILQTVNCIIHAPLREKLHELELRYGQYDVHTLFEALDVSRGTFYNHILRNKRSNAWFEKRREEYRILIQEVFEEYNQVLGAEKIRTILVQRGHQVSTKFVAGLMREMGLTSVRATAKQDYLKLREPEKKKNVQGRSLILLKLFQCLPNLFYKVKALLQRQAKVVFCACIRFHKVKVDTVKRYCLDRIT